MNSYLLSREESDRINILKYIAIVFVVYIHSFVLDVNYADGTDKLFFPKWLMAIEYIISPMISRCGVPLFFLISSILLFKRQRDYKTTLKEKFRTLLIPYMIWNSFWVFVFIVLQNLHFTAPYFSGNHTPILESSFSEWLALYGIGRDLPSPQDYPLWFIRDLLLVTLFFPVVEKAADRFPTQLFAGSVILLVIPADFPLKQALLWTLMGACLVKMQIHMTLLDNVPLWKFVLAYLLSMWITWTAYDPVVDTLFIFVGIVFWTRVTKMIYDCERAKQIFLKLSVWTFMIYVAHEMTLSSLRKICLRLLPTEPMWLLLEYLFLPVVVITGCSVAGAIFKKVAPRLYAISTGAR